MNTIVLAERQTIQNVRELKEEVLAALDNREPVLVDAAEVDQIDTATLQLLAVLWQGANRASKPPRLERPSGEFRRVSALLGLDGLFGIHAGAADVDPAH